MQAIAIRPSPPPVFTPIRVTVMLETQSELNAFKAMIYCNESVPELLMRDGYIDRAEAGTLRTMMEVINERLNNVKEE
jgi:hypothetical protein